VHQLFKSLTGLTIVAVLGSMTGASQYARAQEPQAGQQTSQKKVKDQGEYDLYNAVVKETDPNKKLSLLNTWKEKYPNTDFKQERLTILMLTYQALGQPAKVLETAKELLTLEPKDVQALFFTTALTTTLQNPSPADLDAGEKAANGLLNAQKPASTKEEDWQKAKKDFDALAHKTLGWIAMMRKEPEKAEQEFVESLKINPNAGEVSYWLGGEILKQKKPERQSEALFHFARAAAYDGPGALTPAGRQQVQSYLEKAYNSYHGQDPTGLNELKTQAKSSAFPPPGFKIKTANEIAIEKENEFRQSNPALAMWMNLKKELTGPEGQQFFEGKMKGAEVPGGAGGVQKFKGKLVDAKPAVRSKELVVALADPNVPEVTLKLDSPLAGKPQLGTDVEFSGVPSAFSKDPFMVTFDVEKSKVDVKVEAPAPARRPAARKRSKG